ncbi:hypothetical protein OVA21_04040 [Dietzia sp. SL131]|uniref:hypothetical protein n=1 Tax=Dietzia sp. SL131 TaxID=2995149 RepID=UPI00227A9F8F|nr:hypothetical protein [Dietzia sp. SL131]MCY1656392.1 hypothetical protein [Dietzia sp. SL131]
MSDANRIIAALETTYDCPQPECDGRVAMTMMSVSGEANEFVLQCQSCRAVWDQKGNPLGFEEATR